MSELTDTPRYWRIRLWHVAVVLVLLTLVAIVLSWGGNNTAAPMYEAKRVAYEKALLANPNRVDADFGVQVHDNAGGAMYTYETVPLMMRGKDGTVRNDCQVRCLVGHKTADGYAVTLPVSFTYSVGEQHFSPMPGSQPITELTYWDPQRHMPVTVRAPKGGVVTLPKVLYRRVVRDVRVGETVYTVPQWVRNNGSHLVVIEQATVWYEPGGSIYGMIDLARLTKTKNGFVVCLPQGAPQPIDDKGAYGPVVLELNERC